MIKLLYQKTLYLRQLKIVISTVTSAPTSIIAKLHFNNGYQYMVITLFV